MFRVVCVIDSLNLRIVNLVEFKIDVNLRMVRGFDLGERIGLGKLLVYSF